MEKKWYNISLSAKLDDLDIKALNKYLYQALDSELGITNCSGLKIELEDNQDEE